jgi:sortase A
MKSSTSHGRQSGRYHRIFRWCSRFCLLTGSILLIWCAYQWVDAHAYEDVEGRRFDAVTASRATNPAPVAAIRVAKVLPSRVEIGSVVGRIEIPRIGVSVMVLEGNTPRIFRRAAGHLEGTAAPGQTGNVAIAGHRDTFFRPLRNIHDQDIIKFTTLTRTYWYSVESVEVVAPDDVEVLADSPQPILTLITCYPFYYVGPAPKRFIVHARQVSTDSPPEADNVSISTSR